MKKHVLTIVIIVFAIPSILVLTLCCVGKMTPNDFVEREIPSGEVQNIECHFWKCGNGEMRKDVLDLSSDSRNLISNDTLYMNGIPEAVVLKLVKRYYSDDCTMTVKWLDNGAESYYVSK